MRFILGLSRRLDWFHAALQQSLEPNGIAPLSRAQSVVIAKVAGGERRAINIARELGVSRQAVSQILAELEKRGVILLDNDPSDGRSRIVRFREDFEQDGVTCGAILTAIEEELARRIGKRRVWSLHDAIEAEWGDPPVIADLRFSSTG